MSKHPYRNSTFYQLLRRYYSTGKLPASRSIRRYRWTYNKLAATISSGNEDDFERSFRKVKSWLLGNHIPVRSGQNLVDAFFDRETTDANECADRSAFEKSIDEARAVRQDERARAFFVSAVPDKETLQRVRSFDEIAYGELAKGEQNNVPAAQFEAWWKAYKHGLIGAYSNPDRDQADFVCTDTLTDVERTSVFAVLGFLPVKKAWSEKFLTRRTTERRLFPEDFEVESRYWYLSGISSEPGHLKKVKRVFFIKHFLEKSFAYWRKNSALSGNTVINIVAEGSTGHGRVLLDSLEFKKISEPTHRQELPLYQKVTSVDELMACLSAFRLRSSFPTVADGDLIARGDNSR